MKKILFVLAATCGFLYGVLLSVEHTNAPQNVTFYSQNIHAPERCVLSCDVGGTNTRCALIEVNDATPTIIFVLRFETRDIVSFTDVLLQALKIAREKYNVVVKKAVCAVAGSPINNMDVWSLTNVKLTLRKNEILQKTGITDVVFLNDFAAIGYSLEVLPSKDLICLNQGKVTMPENKVVLGAGTGLGECIVAWDALTQRYLSVSSAGGHVDFPVYNQDEFALVTFYKNKLKASASSSFRFGHILSGRGIPVIYQFFEQDKAYSSSTYSAIIKKNNYDPAIIALYKRVDPCSKKTFEFFCAMYGRCAKNCVLGANAFGGVYLAGGIAAKNPEIFDKDIFMAEFVNHPCLKEFLEQTPVHIILNQDAGLLGAAQLAKLHFKL